MNKFQAELDNRIFAMQQKELFPEAAKLVQLADVAFLQDRDAEALDLIEKAEDVQITLEGLAAFAEEAAREEAERYSKAMGQCAMCGDLTYRDVDYDAKTCRSCFSMLIGE